MSFHVQIIRRGSGGTQWDNVTIDPLEARRDACRLAILTWYRQMLTGYTLRVRVVENSDLASAFEPTTDDA